MLPKDDALNEEEDDDGDYMNPKQLDYFREKLRQWKEDLLRESMEKAAGVLQSRADADLTDVAGLEYDTDLTLQVCNRNDTLTMEIDRALRRINDGVYGYCEETGEKIGLARLEANPITLLCIEEQERREKQQRLYNKEDGDL